MRSSLENLIMAIEGTVVMTVDLLGFQLRFRRSESLVSVGGFYHLKMRRSWGYYIYIYICIHVRVSICLFVYLINNPIYIFILNHQPYIYIWTAWWSQRFRHWITLPRFKRGKFLELFMENDR